MTSFFEKVYGYRFYIVSRKIRVTSQDKQASMRAPRFGTQSKESSKQPFMWGIKTSLPN